MPRYWIIAPVESDPADRFERVWQYDLASNLITIGWAQIGDISNMTREELWQAATSTYPERSPRSRRLITNMLWSFYHRIEPGDFIIARRGRKILAGFGQVVQPAIYFPGENPYIDHPNVLRVSWLESLNKVFPDIVFPMHTLAPVSEEKANQLLRDNPLAVLPDVQEAEEIEDPQAFKLESGLEDFIVDNFNQIFKGRFEIYRDSEGNDGQQYDTDAGRIDILAVEPASNDFVVIELKRGRPADQVVGQVLKYMGWVMENLCDGGQDVRGLIICGDRNPDRRLMYALRPTQNIDVRYYTISFDLAEFPTDRP